MKTCFFYYSLILFLIFTSCITEEECPTEVECPQEEELSSNDFLLHYKFNQNFLDSSPNEYNGTASGVVFGKDRFGNENSAAYFDGVDDFIDLPNVSDLKPQLPVSFSFWVNYSSSNVKDHYIFNTSFEEDRSSGVFFNASGSDDSFSINFGDGQGNYSESTRRTYSSNYSVVPGRWDHIVVIVESAQKMHIYINGVDAEGSYKGSGNDLFYSETPGSIGRSDANIYEPANYFKGYLDDFKYWDRVLTEEEIIELNNLEYKGEW